MMKRFFLMLATTLVVTVVVSMVAGLIFQYFGISYSQTIDGRINYQAIAIISALWGFVGSFISLLMSKWMVKRFFGVQLVDKHGHHRALVEKVHEYARRSGLQKMPEVGIYPSSTLNAFATGPSRNNSLVAVSTGLLEQMDSEEVEGVLAHEVSHIANGDMVTMALVQGIVNAFVLFLSEILTIVIENALRGDDERRGGGLGFFGYFIVKNALYILFGILTAPIVYWFSRYREYRADAGGARLAGKGKMIAALQALQRAYPSLAQAHGPRGSENFQTMQISSKAGLAELFSSHPPLQKRINALERNRF